MKTGNSKICTRKQVEFSAELLLEAPRDHGDYLEGTTPPKNKKKIKV